MKYNLSNIFKNAWATYRMAQKWVQKLSFGECLRRSWATAKAAVAAAAQKGATAMKGTEKQIAWATEIIKTAKTILANTLEETKPMLAAAPEEQKKIFEANMSDLRAKLARMEAPDTHAGDIIDLFKGLRVTADHNADFGSLIAVYRVATPNTAGQRALLGR